MAILAFTGATIWYGLADLSDDAKEVMLDASVAPLDSTTFASGGWVSNAAGLRSAKADVKGNWQAGTADLPDDLSFGNLGTGGVPLTITPAGAAVSNVCYFGSFLEPSYKTGGKVGDLLSFETSLMADAPLVRGQIANASAKTSTGTTTGLNLGAVGAGQAIYCAVHVLTVSGTATPSLTVAVQSGSSSGFASPTTVVTGAAITAPGSQFLTGPTGVNTDTWQRLSLTITGTTPSFLLYAAIGIA
jgi:hypothetical protein